jgi:hypothetical protein
MRWYCVVLVKGKYSDEEGGSVWYMKPRIRQALENAGVRVESIIITDEHTKKVLQ